MTTGKSAAESGDSVGKGSQPSSQAEMDQALAVLGAHKETWAALDIPRRLALLDQLKHDLPKVEKRWIAAGLADGSGRDARLFASDMWTDHL